MSVGGDTPDSLGGWGPPWIRLIDERRAHRSTAAAILGSALRTRGDRSAFALQLRVSPPALARLLQLLKPTVDARQLEEPWPRSQTSTREIASLVGLHAPLAESFMFHTEMSKRRAFDAHVAIQDLTGSGMRESVLGNIHDVYGQAEHSPEGGYRLALDAALAVLGASHPREDLSMSISVLLIAHQCLCVVDRPDQAYYLALLATALSDHGAAGDRSDFMSAFAIQSRCAQGVALANLGLAHAAMDAFDEARYTANPRKVPPGFWTPMVARGKLLVAAARASRHRDNRELAAWRQSVVINRSTPDPERADAMADEAFARALANTGHQRALRQARRIVTDLVAAMPNGALYATQVLKTAGVVAMATGDPDESSHYLGRAREIAAGAGLVRELTGLRGSPPTDRA